MWGYTSKGWMRFIYFIPFIFLKTLSGFFCHVTRNPICEISACAVISLSSSHARRHRVKSEQKHLKHCFIFYRSLKKWYQILRYHRNYSGRNFTRFLKSLVGAVGSGWLIQKIYCGWKANDQCLHTVIYYSDINTCNNHNCINWYYYRYIYSGVSPQLYPHFHHSLSVIATSRISVNHFKSYCWV